MGKLDDRVAIVTGAAQGIGKAVADKLAAEGATVVVADLNGEGAERAAPAGGAGLRVDVSREDEVERMVDETTSRFGKLDVLVNVAAIVPFTPWDEVDFAEWRRIMSVNLDGVFLTCHYAQRPMRDAGYGRIVNIASIAGKDGNPNASHYSASKAGLIGLTKSLAKELATKGVLVNCITPAAAKTEMFDQMKQEHIDYMLSKIPMNRFLEVEELAAMIAWLASEDCSFSTGAVFDISGGRAVY